MNAAVDELRRLLVEQRDAFSGELPDRLLIIEMLCQKVAAGRANTFDRRQLERLAHGLAGSSGLYGYADLGAAARSLELCVHSGDDDALTPALETLKRQMP